MDHPIMEGGDPKIKKQAGSGDHSVEKYTNFTCALAPIAYGISRTIRKETLYIYI